jgi:D-arginine utilization repressor
MNIDLSPYTSICNAMVLLLKPLIEIVIHDLASDRICFIAGELSKRQVGDPSLLDIQHIHNEQALDSIIYPKLNFDGRLIHSISVPLKEKGRTKALLCINCDVSVFHQMQKISQCFLDAPITAQPASLFRKDWQDRLHIAVHEYLDVRGWQFEQLTRQQKKDVIQHLFLEGAFTEKNAAGYIAKTLDIGRATIFNYLKQWRQ